MTRGGTYLVAGMAALVAGVGVLAWERTTESDAELVALPLLLVGLFLMVEGYLVARRARLRLEGPGAGTEGNPK